jgi:hypothetical protein
MNNSLKSIVETLHCNVSTALTLLLLVYGQHSFAQSCPVKESIVIDGEAQPMLGSGLNTESDRYKASGCLNGTVQSLGNGAASLEASITSDYEKIVETEGYKVNGNIKVGWFKIGGSFSAGRDVSHTITQEAFNQTFLLDYKVKMGNEIFKINTTTPFNGFGKAVVGNAASFKNQCGNCFVYQNERGARLQVAMSFNFTSAEYKDSFKTSAGVGIEGLKIGAFSLGASLQGEINKATQQTREHGSLTLSARQIGGSVAYFGQIFGGSSTGVYATQCALTDLTACTNALNSVIAYISSAEFINGLATSSAPLKYYYSSYGDAVPNVPLLAEELTNDILQAREQLKTELVKRETALAQVNRQLLLPFLSTASNDRLTALKNKLAIEITNLQTQGQRCFDVLSSCVAEKNTLLAGLTLLNEQTLGLSLADGMVAYYPFNGNAKDESGNNHNGIVNGATLTTDISGKANSAYSFNGIGNYIKVSSFPDFSQNVAISAWVLAKDITSNRYYEIARSPTFLFSFQEYGKQLTFGINENMSLESDTPITPSSITDGKWHHLVGVKNGGNFSVYLDGMLIETKILNVEKTTGIYDLYIGAAGGSGEFFNGSLDNVRVYNRALTATEVSALFYDKSSKTAISGITDWVKPPYKVTCQNITTNKQVSVLANKTAGYDCGKAGLAATTGQALKVILEGVKY